MKLTHALAAAALSVLAVAGAAATADAATAHPAPSAPTTSSVATRTVIVRPVQSNGRPAPGYRVQKESIQGFSCNEGTSPVAVDPNIRFCGYSATYTMACWKSPHHAVLCLRDPRSTTLARIHYVGSFKHIAAPAHPTPAALRLANSSFCSARDGGAWSIAKQHPSWVGFYSCTHGEIYGPIHGDGIDRAHPRWTVRTFGHSLRGPGTRLGVTRAYYVGTAG